MCKLYITQRTNEVDIVRLKYVRIKSKTCYTMQCYNTGIQKGTYIHIVTYEIMIE